MRAPKNAAGRNTRCPKCGTTLVVPKPSPEYPHLPPPHQTVTSREPTPQPVVVDPPDDFAFAASMDGSSPAPGESDRKAVPGAVLVFQQLDIHTKVAALAAGDQNGGRYTDQGVIRTPDLPQG